MVHRNTIRRSTDSAGQGLQWSDIMQSKQMLLVHAQAYPMWLGGIFAPDILDLYCYP